MVKRKIGLSITTELLLDSSLFVTANCVCCLEHWVPAALFKNHKAFPILIYLSADLAAVLVFISWDTEEQFMAAKTLMSSIQKGLRSIHTRAPRLPLLPVEAGGPLCLRRWTQHSVKGTLTFCHFKRWWFSNGKNGEGMCWVSREGSRAFPMVRAGWVLCTGENCPSKPSVPRFLPCQPVGLLQREAQTHKDLQTAVAPAFYLWSVIGECARIPLCLWHYGKHHLGTLLLWKVFQGSENNCLKQVQRGFFSVG